MDVVLLGSSLEAELHYNSRGFIIAPTFRQGKSLSNNINTHTVNCSQLPFLKGGTILKFIPDSVFPIERNARKDSFISVSAVLFLLHHWPVLSEWYH